MDVGVGENQPIAAGVLIGLLQGVRLAEPARRQFVHADIYQAGIGCRRAFEDSRGAVFRAVVHGDNFIARVIEREKSFERARQFFSFVARGK